jgi:hypothetical protein
MYKFLVVLALSTNLTFASSVKLVDFLVNGTGVTEVLGKYGIKGQDASQVKSYVNASLNALNLNSATPTKKDILDSLAKIPMTGQDANIRKELQVLLDKPESQFTKDDVVKSINHLIYLANRHGKAGSVIITCSECVNDSLAKSGFKFTVETLKDSSTKKVLTEVLPKNPKDLNAFIAARMKRMGAGDYSKVTPDLVSPDEERSLGLFLGLAENGNAKQKELVKAVMEVSKTPNGQVNLIDPKNPHKLWKLLADDMSPEVMDGWIDMLKQVAKEGKSSPSKKDAFYSYLQKKAGNDPVLNDQLKALKAKKCFFK